MDPNAARTKEDQVQLDRIKRFLRLDDAQPLFERVYERRNRVLTSLSTASELISIGRYQGQLEIFNWLLNLKED